MLKIPTAKLNAWSNGLMFSTSSIFYTSIYEENEGFDLLAKSNPFVTIQNTKKPYLKIVKRPPCQVVKVSSPLTFKESREPVPSWDIRKSVKEF